MLGVFRVGRAAGMAALTLLGGMSIGARIVLFRENLLVHSFAVNWGIITILGGLGFIVVLFNTRVAMVRLLLVTLRYRLKQYAFGV